MADDKKCMETALSYHNTVLLCMHTAEYMLGIRTNSGSTEDLNTRHDMYAPDTYTCLRHRAVQPRGESFGSKNESLEYSITIHFVTLYAA